MIRFNKIPLYHKKWQRFFSLPKSFSLFFERCAACFAASAGFFTVNIDRFGRAFAFAVISAVFRIAIDKRAVADAFAERHCCVLPDKTVASCAVRAVCLFSAYFNVFQTAAILLIMSALGNRTVNICHFFVSFHVFFVFGLTAIIFCPINVLNINVKKN